MSETLFDFAVIGAGIAGASIAAELAPNAKVLVLEAEDAPGYHTTGRSAAFWEECYGGTGVVPLTLSSGAYLREGGFLSPRGALYIGRAQDHAEMDAFLRRFAGTGATLERLTTGQLAARMPNIRPEWCDAIHEPACADIDVASLHQHYLKAMKGAGAKIACRARVCDITYDAGLWQLTTCTGQSFKAAQLVNAAGAWADEVAAMAGIRAIGIEPMRRTVAQLRVTPAVPDDMPLVLDIAGSFYFKPDNGRLWLSPHDEIPSLPCDAAPEEIDVARAIARFEDVTNWRIEAVERRWAGLRSFAPDRLPVFGPDTERAGFHWFAGQGGFGIQTAPAAARLGAQVILGLDADAMTQGIDRARYSPSRFSEQEERLVG